jgi:O-antigen ligase
MPKALLVIIILIVTAILVAIPFVVSELIQKLSDYSGMERLKAVVFGFRYFTEYPWLGIGWGVFPTWDFLICFLAGAGIIGLFTFFWVLTGISRNFSRQKKNELGGGAGENQEMMFLRTSVIHSFGILLTVSQISGFIYHSQYFWFILGLTVAVSSVRYISHEKVQKVVYA